MPTSKVKLDWRLTTRWMDVTMLLVWRAKAARPMRQYSVPARTSFCTSVLACLVCACAQCVHALFSVCKQLHPPQGGFKTKRRINSAREHQLAWS